ncbi:uncharacterized protein LOC131847392 [Achroia grisella]|uniref:uncharacterized protein LOC131847392 n=1 Tax=Achroia grisella TaxID=688607 RepID=UPI0027D23719|nr:uncharacterized protein LOC131847392 [Achroia grisella]
MKIFVLLAAMQALVAGQPTRIPAPTITMLVAQNDFLKLSWTKVESVSSNDPIKGYIVIVWQIPDETVSHYKIVDGKTVVVEEKKTPKLDPTKIPSGTPREIKLADADVTTTLIDNIQIDVLYHIRVLAYTSTQEGELSDRAEIKLSHTQ